MEKITLEAVQYSCLSDIDEVQPLNDDDHEVLNEVRDILRKHGVTDRFGVCLLHRHFNLNDNEVVIESTDVLARVSTLAVTPRDTIRGRTIQTMWWFSQNGSTLAGTECRQMCQYDNGGHKNVHVPVGV